MRTTITESRDKLEAGMEPLLNMVREELFSSGRPEQVRVLR